MARRWSSVLSYVARNLWHYVILKIENHTSTYHLILLPVPIPCLLYYPYDKYGVDRPLSGGTQFPFGCNYTHPPD